MEDQITPIVSFAICTHNRAFIINKCLQSILEQKSANFIFEVLIIDNNSTDNTKKTVQPYVKQNPNFRYIFEEKIGLSHARNRAIEEARGEWIIYIDDDAILDGNYFEELEKTIVNYDFDCFGGPYYPWYPYGKPKWLPHDFGLKQPIINTTGYISGNDGFLSGGNFVIKKDVANEIGGFNSEFGMKGRGIAYGEEDELQQRLLKQGKKIGFNPKLSILHAVLKDKLQIRWHLKSNFKRGQTREALFPLSRNVLFPIFEFFRSLIGALIKRVPKSIIQFFCSQNYYIQNVFLDIFSPLAFYLGAVSFHLKK